MEGSNRFLIILGIKRFLKSFWKTFKVDFGELEERISAAQEEVREEIKLASEQAAHRFDLLKVFTDQSHLEESVIRIRGQMV